ncbi:hypothetical protein BX661DRAFT_224990, partial [Kickxella alabastrina]|uniref:uncharacterized protein n=1 Tax=Kickxella alabastrina TaxID=61397 RepID=UPI0022207D3C
DEAACKTDVKIDKQPAVGAVAQTSDGETGHVAWVTKASGNQVTVEEYNWDVDEGYATRSVSNSEFEYYIHLK